MKLLWLDWLRTKSAMLVILMCGVTTPEMDLIVVQRPSISLRVKMMPMCTRDRWATYVTVTTRITSVGVYH